MSGSAGGKPRKPSLYALTAERIKGELLLRGLGAHDIVPSEGEWAKLYGVSRMTTKLALDILAKEGAVYRLARRGTFVSPGFGAERPGREEGIAGEREAEGKEPTPRAKRTIALLLPNMDDYTAGIVEAVQREARKAGCHTLVRLTESADDESGCLQELVDDGIDGIVLYPRGKTRCSEKVLELSLSRYPLVIIDRIFREISIDCVYHDHEQGTYALVEYLIGKGHTRIGYLSLPFEGVTSREDRYQGYSRALLDARLPVDGSRVRLQCADAFMGDLAAPNEELKAFLEANPDMTAVVCMDDYLATSCLYTALSLNRSVPDELSIVGFLDIRLAGLLPVPLTTARQTTEQLGQAAVQLLAKRMSRSREGAITIKVQASIVERGSVRKREV